MAIAIKKSMRICNIRIQVLYYFHPNKVTKVDKTRFDKLIKAKNARVKLGGIYFHQSQCENMPNQFVEGLPTIESATTNSQGLSMV